MKSTRPIMREAPAAGRYASRAKQLGVPGRNSRRARVELVEKRRRARDAPAHPSATEVGDAAKPNQPAGYARPLRRNREPPGRGEVEHSRIAPDLADDAGERGASYPLLHRPQPIAGVTRLDMDEVLRRKPGWVDATALEDRHPI